MRLTVLGSGTMMPTKSRYPSGYLLEYNGTKLLLDCGHLTLARLVEHGTDLHRIDAVAITHFHTDHFGHFLPLVHARWVDDTHAGRAHRPLTVFGPASLEQRWQKLREVSWPEQKELYPLTFHEGPHTAQFGDLTITAFPVRHVQWFESLGYRVQAGGRMLVYTGDMHADQGPEFESAIAGVDLLLIEAGAAIPSPTHLTAEQVVALAQRCRLKFVLLTHIRADLEKQVRAVAGEHPDLLRVAEDGMTIEI